MNKSLLLSEIMLPNSIKKTTTKLLVCVLIFSANIFNVKAADYYWVGGTGNWSDFSNHWATTSGGTVFHTTIPSPSDDVYFDANSFQQMGDTVFGNVFKMFCHNMNWNGVTNNPVFYVKRTVYFPYNGNELNINASLLISDTVTLNLAQINFTSTQTGNTIKSQGQNYDSINIQFTGVNGQWQLIDSIGGGIHGLNIYVTNGTFKTNGHKLNCNEFHASYKYYPTVVDLDSSEINCANWQDADSSICNLNALNATIKCRYDFNGGYGNVYNYVSAARKSSCFFSSINTLEGINCSANNSTITNALMQAGFAAFNSTVTNLVFNDSLVTFEAIGGSFQKVIIPKDAAVNSSAVIDTLLFTSPGSILTIMDTLTVENFIGFGGTCYKRAIIEQDITYSSNKAAIRKTSGSLTLDNVFIQNVAATGGATFTATNSFGEGNTTGWIFSLPITPRNLFWVGDAGNWNDENHWSLSSGGIAGNCPPTIFDSVFFDANSFTVSNQIIALDIQYNFCKNIDFTGSNSPIFFGNMSMLDIDGSMKLEQGMTFKTARVNFKSTAANNYLQTASVNLDSVFIRFEGSGSYALNDSLQMSNGSATVVNNGTFSTNNNNMHCDAILFGWSQNATVDLGVSKIYCTDIFIGDTADLNLQANLAFLSASGNFYSGYQSYKSIVCGFASGGFSASKLECKVLSGGSNSIDTLILTDGELWCHSCQVNEAIFHGNVSSYYISNFHHATFDSSAWFRYGANFDSLQFTTPGSVLSIGDTINVNNYIAISGNCSNFTTIKSTETGTTGFLNVANGAVNFNNVLLTDIAFVGGATYSATNSFNEGNVSGITISAPTSQTKYWVGNGGNWNDPSHWSTSSGGVGGSCTPTKLDDVFFDSNSFSTTNDTVFVATDSIYCKAMNWTGANQPVIFGMNKTLKTYGSLTLETGMKFLVAVVNFESTSLVNTLTSKGQPFNTIHLNFNGANANWFMMDSIIGNPGPFINIANVDFNTNNFNIKCSSFKIPGWLTIDTLKLGTSTINCHEWFATNPYWLKMDSTATIVCDSVFFAASGSYSDINCVEFVCYGPTTFKNVTSDYAYISGISLNPTLENIVCNRLELNYTTIKTATITKSLQTNNSSITQTLYVNAPTDNYPCQIGAYNTNINKAVIVGPTLWNSNGLIDTLILSGSEINFSIQDTLKINKSFFVNSQDNDPAFIQSSNYNTGFLFAPTNDTICLDYIYLKDMHTANDSAVFYAGDYSVDLGNNTGWIWNSCTPDSSNVWPGDANYDLVADNTDLLYVGLSYGYNGSLRANASNNWVAQPCEDWQQQFATGYNIKHADCDGNGIINADDTLAIALNYGLVHPLKLATPPQQNNFGSDLYFDMPAGALVPGSIVSIPINLGTATNPVTNLYGMAFTVNYDVTFIQAGTMKIDFTNSWLGTNLNTLQLTKDNYTNGKIDLGFVKTDHQNSSGSGLFATLTFTVANNVSGFLNLSFSNITALDKNEIPLPINAVPSSVYTSVNELPALENLISVFPNPATYILTVADPNNIVQQLKIIDRIGRVIYLDQSKSSKTQINVAAFNEGIYILRIETTKGILNKKILIQK